MIDSSERNTTELSDQQRVDWLRLIRTENVGPAIFRKLLNRFGSATAALDALPGLSKNGGSKAPINTPTQDFIEDQIARTQSLGGRIVGAGEAAYPKQLKFIPASPPMITIKGGAALNWSRTVGIVGGRNASAAGHRMTRLVTTDLGDAGYTIVSGLARGIDAAAHQASLKTGTVAVLAGGLDSIYPAENIPLAQDIVENGGALLTEMPLGWEPRARDFPRRNRLVSGLSLGVVVVEAAKRSGSLITARLALEQNREVFAVPGSPLDPRAQGGNSLIQQGAMLVNDATDITGVLSDADPSRHMLFENEDEQFFDFESVSARVDHTPAGDERAKVLEALSPTPISVEELVYMIGISAAKIQIILMELDLAGRLDWSEGQQVALK